MVLHTKYQGSRPCGSRPEDFFSCVPYTSLFKTCDPGAGPFLAQKHNLIKIGVGPLDDTLYQILML